MKKTNNPNNSRNNQLSGNERIVNRANQRRKKNKRKKLIFRAALCSIFLLAGIILVLTMFFNINEITVTGDTVYSAESVIAKSGIEIGDNLIFISKSKINEKISTELPYVGSVKIKRHLPTKLELEITKTEAVYAISVDGCYTLLNEDGKVLEKGLEYVSENIILLNIGEVESIEEGAPVIAGANYLEKLMNIRRVCVENGFDGITSMDLADLYDIKIVYEGRITLELGETNKENLPKKLALGKAAIETQNDENPSYKGTINLTVDGKGYWSEETSTTEPVTNVEESTTESVESEVESTTQSAA